jgi:hypothetical protein
MSRLILINSIIVVIETHILFILVLIWILLNLIHLFSHNLTTPLRILYSPLPIHHTILQIDTILHHKPDYFLQTLNHKLPLSVLFIAFPVPIPNVQLVHFLVQFLLQVVELETEIVNYLRDLMFERVRMTRLGQGDFVRCLDSGVGD